MAKTAKTNTPRWSVQNEDVAYMRNQTPAAFLECGKMGVKAKKGPFNLESLLDEESRWVALETRQGWNFLYTPPQGKEPAKAIVTKPWNLAKDVLPAEATETAVEVTEMLKKQCGWDEVVMTSGTPDLARALWACGAKLPRGIKKGEDWDDWKERNQSNIERLQSQGLGAMVQATVSVDQPHPAGKI